MIGFKARNHRQQVAKRGPNPKVDDRATPPELFDPLMERFGFTIDVAASAKNTKCERFYTIEDNALSKVWHGERVWCNPPYSDIRPWVDKATGEWFGPFSHSELIVMLLPANRTEQAWWQDYIEPARIAGLLTVEFIRGRQRFLEPGDTEIKPNARPPFGVCLVIWR